MLEKEIVVDNVMIDDLGRVFVRETTRYLEDGVEMAKKYHRTVITPDDDVTSETARVQSIAAAARDTKTLEKWEEQKQKDKNKDK